MQQQSTDVLDPGSLPVDPREAALLLLGMTAGELKSIDEKVISGRNSVGGIRSDINKIVSDIRGMPAPGNARQPKPAQQPQRSVPQPVPQPVPVQPAPQPSQPTAQLDPNQLEFDFYKKIKPEDIEYQLRLIQNNIKSLETKVDIIIDYFKKKDIANGNHDQ